MINNSFLHETLNGRGVMVSDFHRDGIVWRTSTDRVRKIDQYLEDVIRTMDFLFVNGDAIELQQPRTSYKEALKQGADYIEHLASINPKCQIIYNQGNHDDLAYWSVHLMEIAERTGNLRVVESLGIMKNAYFYHGDVKKRNPSVKWRNAMSLKSAGEYKEEVKTPNDLIFERRKLEKVDKKIRKIFDALKKEGLILDGLEHVFLAHMHEAFAATPFEYDDKVYKISNAGGAMQGAEFKPILIECADGRVNSVGFHQCKEIKEINALGEIRK